MSKLKTSKDLQKSFFINDLELKIRIAMGNLTRDEKFLLMCALYCVGYQTGEVDDKFGISYNEQQKIVTHFCKGEMNAEALAVRLRNLTEAEAAIKILRRSIEDGNFNILKELFPNLVPREKLLTDRTNAKIIDVEFTED